FPILEPNFTVPISENPISDFLRKNSDRNRIGFCNSEIPIFPKITDPIFPNTIIPI
ncbi:hypothetical protein GIB67_028489, partial [Kingdonia uniflora]